MRKTVLVAVVAWCAGFAAAAVTAHAYTKLNAWRSHGDQFQLGYVVGYIDAVKLSKFKDTRAMIPTSGRGDYLEWRTRVNVFYEDPGNVERPIPDAMRVVGEQFQMEILEAFKERRKQARNAAPDAAQSPERDSAPEAAPE